MRTLLLALLPLPVLAAEPPPAPILVQPDGEGAMTVTVRRGQLAEALPALQRDGALPPALTAEEAAQHPLGAAAVVAMAAIVEAVRTAPPTAPVRWTARLAGADQAGAQDMFTLVLDPAASSRLWQATQLPAAAAFRYNLRFAYELSRETGGSIDDD